MMNHDDDNDGVNAIGGYNDVDNHGDDDDDDDESATAGPDRAQTWLRHQSGILYHRTILCKSHTLTWDTHISPQQPPPPSDVVYLSPHLPHLIPTMSDEDEESYSEEYSDEDEESYSEESYSEEYSDEDEESYSDEDEESESDEESEEVRTFTVPMQFESDEDEESEEEDDSDDSDSSDNYTYKYKYKYSIRNSTVLLGHSDDDDTDYEDEEFDSPVIGQGRQKASDYEGVVSPVIGQGRQKVSHRPVPKWTLWPMPYDMPLCQFPQLILLILFFPKAGTLLTAEGQLVHPYYPHRHRFWKKAQF